MCKTMDLQKLQLMSCMTTENERCFRSEAAHGKGERGRLTASLLDLRHADTDVLDTVSSDRNLVLLTSTLDLAASLQE